MIKNWIAAARPRTLPLSLASVFAGSSIAKSEGVFSLPIFIFTVITTVALQVLSNFANDYGDSIHGADNKDRKGQSRAVQSGAISLMAMKTAVIITALISLFSGFTLLYLAFAEQLLQLLIWLGIGLGAIAAAYYYTNGKMPYGYAGFGDISVFIFFGLVGVFGSYYLHTLSFNPIIFLIASWVGLWATAVLNINNIRDIESDTKAGKISIPVRIGKANAVIYHYLIMLLPVILLGLYFKVQVLNLSSNVLLFIGLTAFIAITLSLKVAKSTQTVQYEKLLKLTGISTFLCVLLFSVLVNL